MTDDVVSKLTCLSFFSFKRYFNVSIIYFLKIVENTRELRNIENNVDNIYNMSVCDVLENNIDIVNTRKDTFEVEKTTTKVVLKLASELKLDYSLSYLKTRSRRYLARVASILLIWYLRTIVSSSSIKLALVLKK